MVSSLPDVPHQRSGIDGCPSVSPQDSSSTRSSHSSGSGQPDRSPVHQTRRLSFSSSECGGSGIGVVTSTPLLVLYHSSSLWSSQCSHGHSFEGFPAGDRVVARSPVLFGFRLSFQDFKSNFSRHTRITNFCRL